MIKWVTEVLKVNTSSPKANRRKPDTYILFLPNVSPKFPHVRANPTATNINAEINHKMMSAPTSKILDKIGKARFRELLSIPFVTIPNPMLSSTSHFLLGDRDIESSTELTSLNFLSDY